MALDRCSLTDLLTTECAHCRNETLGDEPERPTVATFEGLLK